MEIFKYAIAGSGVVWTLNSDISSGDVTRWQPHSQDFSVTRLTTHALLPLFPEESGAQGPEEMCLSLEHQNPSKTSEKMGYFDRVNDRVTVLLQILCTANQETDGSQDRLTVFIKIPLG